MNSELAGLAAIQKATEATLRDLIGPLGTQVALLDFPRYQNAGDSMIWLGQMSYLRRLGYPINYMASMYGYNADELCRRVPTGPILLSGGGNLGDRFPHHQSFREQVLADFPDRRVIQLPQSIDFVHDDRRRQTRRLFAAHPNLVVLAREARSLEFARSEWTDADVRFCPDMAYGLGSLRKATRPDVDVQLILRDDDERVPRDYTFPDGVGHRVSDWAIRGRRGAVEWRLLRLPEDVAHAAPRLGSWMYPLTHASLEAMANLNIRHAQANLGRGRVVITDRLHAMVLAQLSRIPVVALDNAYGKVSGVYDAYAGTLPGSYLAASGEEAVSLAIGLVANPSAAAGHATA